MVLILPKNLMSEDQVFIMMCRVLILRKCIKKIAFYAKATYHGLGKSFLLRCILYVICLLVFLVISHFDYDWF